MCSQPTLAMSNSLASKPVRVAATRPPSGLKQKSWAETGLEKGQKREDGKEGERAEQGWEGNRDRSEESQRQKEVRWQGR